MATRKKARRKASATEIAKRFPGEWNHLQRRFAEEEKPAITSSILRPLAKEAQVLINGEIAAFGPTARFPLIIHYQMKWEEGDSPSFVEVTGVSPRKGASKQEKALVDLLEILDGDVQSLEDDIWQAVERGRPYKDFHKRIQDLLKRGEQLEEKHHFDFDDWLEGLMW